MLRLKLDKTLDGKIVFNYYPEDKEEFGTITVDEKNGEIQILNQANNDEFGDYKVHAISKIREYIKNKEYQLDTIVAWY